MPQADGPAVDVDLLNIDLKVLDARNRLTGKGFVDLPSVDVINGESSTLKGLARRWNGP